MGGIVAHAYAGVMDFKAIFVAVWEDFETRVEAYRGLLRGACLFFGPCFLLLTLFFVVKTFFFLHSGVTTNGTVVSLTTQHGSEHDLYAPVFIFKAADGRQYKATSNVAADPPEYTVGDAVLVIYQRQKPAVARIGTFWGIWWEAVLAGSLGVGLVGFGCLLLFYERWLGRRGLSLKPIAP